MEVIPFCPLSSFAFYKASFGIWILGIKRFTPLTKK